MTLAGHPFDTAKVRLQTQSSTNPIYCELLCFLQDHFGIYHFRACPVAVSCQVCLQATGHHSESLPITCAAGALDVVKKTIQWEGPQGLYKVSCCSS